MKRIIPCLDVKDGRVVKGQKFKNLEDLNDPEVLAEYYNEQGADELVFYDITATSEDRPLDFDFVEKVAAKISIPFCVGGGVRSVEDIARILKKGATKISINSQGVRNPDLLAQAAREFGSDSIVLGVDAKRNNDGSYDVYISGGREKTNWNVVDWVKKAVELGVGEIVLNSIDEDGMKNGYDIELLKVVGEAVDVPIIASGGAGKFEDFLEAAEKTKADGLLAAGIFHRGEVKIPELKKYLKENGIDVSI